MRMTTDEMAERYPNTWLGLSDVEHERDGANIRSAEVVYTDRSASELAEMSIRHTGIQPYYTTPNGTFDMGGITW